MIYSAIICIIFFAAAAMWLTRFVGEAGIKLSQNRVMSFIRENKAREFAEERATKKEYLYIAAGVVVFRIIVLFAGWMGYGIFQTDPIPSLMEYLNKWNLWDAQHYVSIASDGYVPVPDGRYLTLVFFPLYPMLLRLVHAIIPNYVIAGMVFSTVCYAIGCILVYKLALLDYSKSVARKALMFMSIYPWSYYFGGIMTESLFLVMAAATFLAVRKHNWWLAGLFGMLAAATRSFGVLLIIPAAAEWVQHERPFDKIREKQWKTLGRRFAGVLPILLMMLGTVFYLYCNYSKTGDPFIFLKYQRENWSQGVQFFGKTLAMICKKLVDPGTSWTNAVSIFMSGIVSCAIIAPIILYSVRRARSMYVVFALVYFAFNAGAMWPMSLARYLSCLFPMFWVLADFTDRHKDFELPIAGAMAIFFGVYLTGFLTVHQIM